VAEPARKSGIEPVGDLPWGTHFCHFFSTREDLLETLVPFFVAGLEGGELCLWIVSEPLNIEHATRALREAVPDFDLYQGAGAMEVLSDRDWYLRGDTLAFETLARAWDEKLAWAVAHGFSGVRANGSGSWLEEKDRQEFLKYERRLAAETAGKNLILACSYSLASSGAVEVLNVVRSHEFALAKREGRWEVLETQELRQAKTEIRRLNSELEERIAQRTAQLAAANQELRQSEDHERQVRGEAEAALVKLRAIGAITDSALAHLGIEELLHELLARLREVLGADHAAVMLLDEDDNGFTVRAVEGADAARFAGARVPIGSPIAGRVARAGRALVLNDLPPPEAPEWGRESHLMDIRLEAALGAPLSVNGRTFGVVTVTSVNPRQFTPDDLELMSIVADRVSPAIERGRLLEQVRTAQEQQRVLSRRILTAQEEERRRLAAELHDELGQILTAVKIALESVPEPGRLDRPNGHLKAALASVDQAMSRVHDLALNLRPAVLDDLGLAAALRWYVDRFARAAGLEAHLALQPIPRFDSDVETACFRIVQETLTNAARHAQARHFWVALEMRGRTLELRMRDDGIGFDVPAARARARGGGSMGLLGMEERVTLLGGTLRVRSQPRKGSEIRAHLPLPPAGGGAP
jgi:signal transduction histidine kinase